MILLALQDLVCFIQNLCVLQCIGFSTGALFGITFLKVFEFGQYLRVARFQLADLDVIYSCTFCLICELLDLSLKSFDCLDSRRVQSGLLCESSRQSIRVGRVHGSRLSSVEFMKSVYVSTTWAGVPIFRIPPR